MGQDSAHRGTLVAEIGLVVVVAGISEGLIRLRGAAFVDGHGAPLSKTCSASRRRFIVRDRFTRRFNFFLLGWLI